MARVLVTGASGFIAKHIVRELLEQGHEVRGSIRSEKRRAELDALFGEGTVEYAMLDLTQDDGWFEAMDGIDALLHTASPFPAGDPADPQELIRPAVDFLDIARMHVAAITTDESIGHRFPANVGALYLVDAAKALAEAFPERKIPTRQAPDLLVRLGGLFDPNMKSAARSLGRNQDDDGSDAERTFGLTYIPAAEALEASIRSIDELAAA